MLPVSETDFETQVLEAGVNVFFKPTKSHYTFLRLSNDKYVARSAPLSRDGESWRFLARLLRGQSIVRNIQHTVRYTELSPTRFKGLWRD